MADSDTQEVPAEVGAPADFRVYHLAPRATGDNFETVVISINTAMGPIQLVGPDRSRIRLLVRASADDVFIGQKAQLINGLGYPVPQNQGDELRTTDEIWVMYNPETPNSNTVRIAAWIDKVRQ